MWGPWAMGMAVTNIKLKARFEAVGLQMLVPQYGLTLLERVLLYDIPESVGAQFTSENFAHHAGVAKPMSKTKSRQSSFLGASATSMVRILHVRNGSVVIDVPRQHLTRTHEILECNCRHNHHQTFRQKRSLHSSRR